MKYKVSLVLIAALMCACGQSDIDNNYSQSETGVTFLDRILDSSKFPNTSTWTVLLNQTLETSYKRGERICAKVGKKKDNDIVVSNISGEKSRFMDYRYTVPTNSSNQVKEQLDLLQKLGFLKSEVSAHEGLPVTIYQITKKGWAQSPVESSYSNSLCYATGKWTINKILDYELVDNHESGLDAYNVTFEMEYILYDWVDREVLRIFEQKRQLPKQSKTLLVKGPKGYFNPNLVGKRMRYQNTLMPTPEEGTKILLNDDRFIENLCTTRSIKTNFHNQCEAKDEKLIRESLIVHNVGVSNRGNKIISKFSFTGARGHNQLGNVSLKLDQHSRWVKGYSSSIIPQ